MKKKFFEDSELLELEALEVKGGDRADPMAQEYCTNKVDGCGANVDQKNCVNEAVGCGGVPTVPNPTQNPCVILNSCTLPPVLQTDCPK